jgi:hypothetical protein
VRASSSRKPAPCPGKRSTPLLWYATFGLASVPYPFHPSPLATRPACPHATRGRRKEAPAAPGGQCREESRGASLCLAACG